MAAHVIQGHATLPPPWVETFSFVVIVIAIVCAAAIAIDLRQRPQEMWIMNLVWPLTALYAGPLGLWAYFRIGRPREQKPVWAVTLTSATHCSAGCAIGDFIGEWIVFFTGLLILRSKLTTKYVVAFALAYPVGIFFQYFRIAPMCNLGLGAGLWAAVRADTLSLVAYEVDMFAWMAVVRKRLFPGLEPTTWTFWLMMQIAMLLGLATTYPANRWLIRRGVKEAM